jgi:hypothetical protein
MMFSEAFAEPPAPSVDQINDMYDGWDVKLEKIFFVNGAREFFYSIHFEPTFMV